LYISDIVGTTVDSHYKLTHKILNQHHLKGQEASKNGNFEEALKHFNLANEVEPDNANILTDRAVAYFQLKRNELAMMDFNKAQELEPNRGYHYASRGFIKSRIGDIEGAIADYNEALRLDPDDAITLNNLGLLEEQRGDIRSANSFYRKSDSILGIKTNATRMAEDEAKQEAQKTVIKPSFITVLASLFTKKGFKEFRDFIKRGFKS